MSRQRAVAVLLGAAIGVVLVDTVLLLAISSRDPLPAFAIAILRVAAVVMVRRLLVFELFAGSGAKLLMYAAALFAVFGSKLTWSVHDWLWPAACRALSGIAPALDLLDRILAAAIAALILSAILVASRSNQCQVDRPPRAWSVALIAGLAFAFLFLLGQEYLRRLGIEPWCDALTNDALPSPFRLANEVVSGFEEEIVLTGIPLALLAFSRWPAMAAAVAVNVLARSTLHLYYTEQATTLWWVGWVAIWSGAALMVALLVGRQAISMGMSVTRCVLAYTVTTAATHSLTNLVGPGGTWLLTCGLTVAVVVCMTLLKRRNPLWWLEGRNEAAVPPVD
ncbi:hypothetical protein ACNQVK_04520 [Mycobacterium sp. 134]|uniref:hypothetical protein n=1 Tax=Mycobacteriaceae TaxID=1762 RepID=UPI003AAA833D